MQKLDHYRLLAELFQYPAAEYPQKVMEVKQLLDQRYPEAAAELDQFLELLPADDLLTMQELFTRSFDVQAVTTLDVGYVLFGDDYKRGEMLANLNREHSEAQNDCGTELADHLPNVLRLIPELRDEELVEDLAYAILAPALSEMIREFSTDRIQKKNESYKKHYKTIIETPAVAEADAVTLYQFALKSLYSVLKQDFSRIQTTPLKRLSSNFLGSIKVENEIEEKAEASN